MHTLFIVIHVIVAALLITVILIQRGRGGGLVESFSGVESMFGTKTSGFLTRATAILATLFMITSVSLALMAARQSRSIIDEEQVSVPVVGQEQETEEELTQQELKQQKQSQSEEVKTSEENQE